jgi:hypothetical protein
MKIIKTGDLVYSFADRNFYIVLHVHEPNLYELYSEKTGVIVIIDLTLTQIESLPDDYKNKSITEYL